MSTGLLQKLPEYAIEDCAFVFENQRSYNENDTTSNASFKRCSIPLCRRIMDSLRVNMNVKSRLVEDNKFDQWFDTRLKYQSPVQPAGRPSLDAEVQYIAEFARDVVSRINEYMSATGKYENRSFYFLGLGVKDGSVVVFHS